MIEIELFWFIIFVYTAFLSFICVKYGIDLLTKVPRRWSSISLGFNFQGHAINFLTYPFIILDASTAGMAYQFQVIGYMLATWSSFIFARSLGQKPTKIFCIITLIPAILITLVVWISAPFAPYPVIYGYELEIEPWFMGMLGTYGYIGLLYLVWRFTRLYRGTSNPVLKKRLGLLIGGNISLVASMTLLLTVLPIMLQIGEIKMIGVLIATICLMIIYRGFRPLKNEDFSKDT